jgi:hypothetical protein
VTLPKQERRLSKANEMEAMLSAEVLTAWDRTEAGAMLLKRVLRALHRDASR